MPTENISLVSTSQPAASLMAESANSASSNSAAGLDSSSASFEKILSNETNTLDTSSNNPSPTIAEKPCIAQFMAMTGCDFSTASKALYQYGNWQDYIKNNATIPDLSNAQAQLSNEVSAGHEALLTALTDNEMITSNLIHLAPTLQEKSSQLLTNKEKFLDLDL